LGNSAKSGLVVIAFMLASCAARYTQVYSGPELPRHDIALIEGEKHGAKPWPELQEWVVIRKVDGTELEQQLGEWPTRIQVLPGHRTFELNSDYHGYGTLMQTATDLFHDMPNQTLAIDAQAGHEYVIRFRRTTDKTVFPPTTSIAYWIEDAATNEVVSGTKSAP